MLEVYRLNAEDARDHDFDCGDTDLNEFFFEDSRLASQELISVTYAWKQNGKTLGYFSLSNDSVKRELFSKPQIKNVARPKRYATLPAVKIGRLAVAHKAKKQGIGSNILSFIKVWFTDDNKTGCRFIIVDAYNNEETIHFYKKNHFAFLLKNDELDETRLMIFDLKNIPKD
jgi:GNAT superfamily N-acetyltransferase